MGLSSMRMLAVLSYHFHNLVPHNLPPLTYHHDYNIMLLSYCRIIPANMVPCMGLYMTFVLYCAAAHDAHESLHD